MQTSLIRVISNSNLAIMLLLSIWQLHRAYGKYELIHHQPQVPLTEKSLHAHRHDRHTQAITIHPSLEQKRFFIIDPALKNHSVGIELLGIHHSKAMEKPIIVHLGWHKNAEQAQAIIDHANKQTQLDGQLYRPKGRLLRQIQQHSEWPKKLSFIDLEAIEKAMQTSVFEQLIVTQGSYLYESISNQDSLTLGISRHICYALQFAAFGIIGIYWRHNLERNKNAPQ